ncbi:MAG: DUF523 domain-containing protein [Gammaproteobacteria bacterium]|nr:DUF523 domain-containing protein [Gammaproteobacteria bacterium]
MKNNNRLRIAVSACLLGESVRYGGGHKRHAFIVEQLAKQCEVIAICPEVGIGLGVPRPPIQLRREGDAIQARGVVDTEQDFTVALQVYARQQVQLWSTIDGYIFKSRSPSCGLHDVPIVPAGKGAGIYAAEWLRCHPLLPMVDEQALQDAAGQRHFLERVTAYRRLYQQ